MKNKIAPCISVDCENYEIYDIELYRQGYLYPKMESWCKRCNRFVVPDLYKPLLLEEKNG